MSIRCPYCGAIASYPNEIGHRRDCVSFKVDYEAPGNWTKEEIEWLRQFERREAITLYRAEVKCAGSFRHDRMAPGTGADAG